MPSNVENARNAVQGRMPYAIAILTAALFLTACGNEGASGGDAAFQKAMDGKRYSEALCIKPEGKSPKYCSCLEGMIKKALGTDYSAYNEIIHKLITGSLMNGTGDDETMERIAAERGMSVDDLYDRYFPSLTEDDIEKKCGKYDN